MKIKVVNMDIDSYTIFGLSTLFVLAAFATGTECSILIKIVFALLVMWIVGFWIMTVCALIYYVAIVGSQNEEKI